MKITDFITEAFIKTDVESEDKDELFEELVEVLVRNHPEYDRGEVLRAITEREAKMSTGIGKGIAIPHGKTSIVKDLCGVIGISRAGIDYDSLDGEPVHVIFMLLAPLDSAGPHIKALQKIAILMKDRGFYQRLGEAGNPHAVYQIILNEENRLEAEE